MRTSLQLARRELRLDAREAAVPVPPFLVVLEGVMAEGGVLRVFQELLKRVLVPPPGTPTEDASAPSAPAASLIIP